MLNKINKLLFINLKSKNLIKYIFNYYYKYFHNYELIFLALFNA